MVSFEGNVLPCFTTMFYPAMAAPGRQGSQVIEVVRQVKVISRSENPQARSPDAIFAPKS